MAKSEPRQTPIGTCGHKIQREQISKRFEWRCTEPDKCPATQCDEVIKFDHNQLAPRGKAK